MESTIPTKEVYFHEWCPKCKYSEIDEKTMKPDDPCWDCLYHVWNIDSNKPINFKEKGV